MGVVVINWVLEKVVGVERYSHKVMKVNVIIGDAVWEVVSCYCSLNGRSATVKEFFSSRIKLFTEVLLGGDFSGHAGCDVGAFGEVNGGFGIGQVNNGGSD